MPRPAPDRLLVAYAVAGVLVVGLVLGVPALYLVDLPAWTYAGAVWAREIADATSTPASLVAYPVPNALATALPGVLVGWLGAAGAGKAVAVGLVAGGWAAAWALARAGGEEGAAGRAAVLASCLVLSSSFWNGYVGFQMGVVGAMALGAVWLRHGRVGAPVLGGAAVALFFCHAIPFAAVALGAGLDALRRRDGRQVAALVPAAALTAWYVAARAPGAVAADASPAGVGHAVLYKAYTALKVGPFQHALGPDGRGLLADVPAVYWALVGGAALFVAVLVAGLVGGTARLVREGSPRRVAAGYAWALVVASLALPAFALNVVNPGERVMALGALGLVAVVPLPRRLVAALGVGALLFVADDAAALWAQRRALPEATLAAMTAERTASERRPAGPPTGVGASPYAAGALPYLNHPLYLHADLYAAADRGDGSRRLFDSGLLRPAAP